MKPHLLLFAILSCVANLACAAFSLGAKDPIDPEQAYQFSARAIDSTTLEARWKIADGYYLYRPKIHFSATPSSVKLGEPVLPQGVVKEDEFFGKVEIYRGDLVVLIPVSNAVPFTLKADSQGCWDGGVCYPPMTQQVAIDLTVTSTGGNESGRIAHLLNGASFWMAIASFFGFGLLLAFTPCVFPMIPILSGIIVHHGHAVTHARAFLLSAAYVLGMALTYAGVGVAAGFSGTLLSTALQNAWVLGGFALIFVALAFSMFGFYELQLPSALQSRLSESANRQGGSLHAIALMGALSALIVGPCVAAPLAGALLYIAQTKDAVLGGLALFVMALGMGLPLLAVGLFSRSLLPKPGPWMKGIQKFFGIVMLATAYWMVMPVLPAELQLSWGNEQPTVSAQSHSKFTRVLDMADLNEQLQQAARLGKPVLLDFYADWCISCKELEKFTFADPTVAAKMEAFVLLQADVTANSPDDKALLKRFNLFGPPGIIFFDKTGKIQEDLAVIGYVPPAQFLPLIEQASR